MELIHSIFYRKINPSDFKKLYDIDRPSTGGGQTYLEAAGIDTEELINFLSIGEMSDSPLQNETRHIFTIDAYVLGEDGNPTKLEFAPRGGRNNYRISRQNMRYKHPAWRVENGFPEPRRDTDNQYLSDPTFTGIIDNLVIFIIRTSYNRYFASFLNTDSLPDGWPEGIGLEGFFNGQRRGILNLLRYNIRFINDKENPFGMDEFSLIEEDRVVGGSNILLYGVPGSGKSYTIENNYCNDFSLMERVVFHPDYMNTDFVGQILPTVRGEGDEKEITYDFTPGPFTRVLKKAINDPGKHYYLVIEEINRGNAPAIFGEIFQLLDRESDGTSSYKITNYNIASEVFGNKETPVFIPSNLSILATMNTADQNVFTLDTAFQRRWDMKMIENDVTKAEHAKTKILDTTVTWEKFNTVVNEQILTSGAATLSSEDKRLGSYFVTEDVLKYFTMDADKNEIAEKYSISLENDQELERKINDLNSRFGDKVIKYLWDDVFKFSRDDLFESTYKSLEKVLYDFNRFDGDKRFDIFKQDIKDNLFSENNIEETRNE